MVELKQRLYAAYGSNLNLEQMARRCPTARVIGRAVLEDWQLLFYGVATIERNTGGYVPVLVWEIQPSDEAALDIYEGYPRSYRKETVTVSLNGRLVQVMVYVMNDGQLQPPYAGYLQTILSGYKSAGFDVGVLRKAVAKSHNAWGALV